MRKIREVLRLAAQGLSTREMASSLAIGRTTLREYLYRARAAGLGWPVPDDLSDGDLERMLFPRAAGGARDRIPQPDWAYVHAELRRTGVTLGERLEATPRIVRIQRMTVTVRCRRSGARPA
jgi:transposase